MSESQPIKLKHSTRNQFLGLVVVSSGFFYGFTLCEFNNFFEYFIQGKFQDTIKLSDYNGINSLLNTFMTLGGLTATLVSGFLIKRLSLRTLVISSCLLHILFRFLQIVSNLPGLYVCQLVIGFFIAMNCYICQMYVLDLFPKEHVGFINSATGFFISAGIITASFMKSNWTREYWFVVVFIPGFLDLLRLIFIVLLFCYKTPFQILKEIDSKMDTSETISLKENSQNDEMLLGKSEKIQDLTAEGGESNNSQTSHLYNKFVLNPSTLSYLDNFCEDEDKERSLSNFFAEYLHQRKENDGSMVSVLFSRKYRLQIFLGVLINFLTQMTGIGTLDFYSKDIFTDLSFSNAESLTIICSNSLIL